MITSIIPPKSKLIQEYNYHSLRYDDIQSDAHLDDFITQQDSEQCTWHRSELVKLEKVLDALYPDWRDTK